MEVLGNSFPMVFFMSSLNFSLKNGERRCCKFMLFFCIFLGFWARHSLEFFQYPDRPWTSSSFHFLEFRRSLNGTKQALWCPFFKVAWCDLHSCAIPTYGGPFFKQPNLPKTRPTGAAPFVLIIAEVGVLILGQQRNPKRSGIIQTRSNQFKLL